MIGFAAVCGAGEVVLATGDTLYERVFPDVLAGWRSDEFTADVVELTPQFANA